MKNKELVVGIFSVVAIVLLYFGFNFLKGIDFFRSSAKYYVIYNNIDDLQVSNPVKLNGFAIGRVSHIQMKQDEAHSVIVEIDIDPKIKLGDSTRAILDSELLGGNYLLLSIGPIKAPLKPGDTIRSEVAKGMFDLLTETAEPVAGNLQLSLRKFNTAIESMTRNSQRLDTILLGLQSTPGVLNATLKGASRNLDEVSTEFKSVASKLNQTLGDLQPVLANIKVLSDSLKQMKLNQTVAKTQQTLTSLNATLSKLSKGDNTAGRLLTEDSLYVNLNRLLVRMDSLVEHLNNYPKHFTAPLGKSHNKVKKDMDKLEEEKRKAAEEKRKTASKH